MYPLKLGDVVWKNLSVVDLPGNNPVFTSSGQSPST